jgi:chromatin assembly factor 1 subunit A
MTDDKDARKAEKEAETAAKKAKREAKKKADEEKQRKREEEDKKARSQTNLKSFFSVMPSTPKEEKVLAKHENGQDRSPAGASLKGIVVDESVYAKTFKKFFVKEDVKMAKDFFEMDRETKQAKGRILDEYIKGQRGIVDVMPFDPAEILCVPPVTAARGRVYPNVKKIMTEHDGISSTKPVDLTTESQNTAIQQTRQALKRVPTKFLCFTEDVRPPYFGTVTNTHADGMSMRRLARIPISKGVLPLNYENDSEAEWQEEDGEDVDLDDDEEDLDNGEDMGDFLDDSEDTGPARPAFSSGMEPSVDGPSYENHFRRCAVPKMYKYRMEFILGKYSFIQGSCWLSWPR